MTVRPVRVSAGAISRRDVLRGLASASCVVAPALALGGCEGLASVGDANFDASAISASRSLLVATTRKPVQGARERPWFGTERWAMSLARVHLTPPDSGRFSLAAVGLSDWGLERVDLMGQSASALGPATSGRDVLIYVHGFNQTFETAALDAARLSDGIRFHGETVAFCWPSRAKLFDYGYDRDSAMWSRDALHAVLDALLASPTTGRVNIVAHSVGSMLAMEALRELYAERGGLAADRIGALVFAAPDVDMDVFTSSVEHIGPLARKITVITATNDRALALSGWMAGGVPRAGAAETAKLKLFGVHVVDASEEGWGVINHDLFLSNDQIRGVIRQVIANAAST
ncbi:MAG TPA: alpha/beta hydrolase [Xanthobacteraceae bacterium]